MWLFQPPKPYKQIFAYGEILERALASAMNDIQDSLTSTRLFEQWSSVPTEENRPFPDAREFYTPSNKKNTQNRE